MQKEQFLAVGTEPWWFLERDLDPLLEQRRKSLGECWGWTDYQWYTEQPKLEDLFRFLEGTRPDLLRDLDESVDVDRRRKWLDDMIEAKRPPDPGAPDAPPAPKPADTAAARTGTVAPAAPRRASAFGRTPPAEATTAPATEAATETTTTAPPAAPAAPPVKKSIFKKAAPPTAPAPPREPAAGAGTPDAPTLEELTETLSELAANPESAISEEELEEARQDPDFAAKLAAAEAELQAELEAELAAAETEE